MTRPPCDNFQAGPLARHRCQRCGWVKSRHTQRRKRAYCPQTQKIRHASRAAAAKHLNRLMASDRLEAGETLHVYPCQYCRHWHVGHGNVIDVATTPKEEVTS